jgi:cell division protein FtsB
MIVRILNTIKKLILGVPRKYYIAVLIGIVWISFFDTNRIPVRIDQNRELNQLKKDRLYYKKKIEEDRTRINELKTNKKNLEKFAREQYMMKNNNEDIFIIIEEDDK